VGRSIEPGLTPYGRSERRATGFYGEKETEIHWKIRSAQRLFFFIFVTVPDNLKECGYCFSIVSGETRAEICVD
jgi:hypothetical protein